MTQYLSNEEIEKEFDKEFKDLTHVGCEGVLPCGTVKNDVKKWMFSLRLSDLDAIIEGIEKLPTRAQNVSQTQSRNFLGKEDVISYLKSLKENKV